jgi:oxaloacetate decarboxylase alpha subunit/acetyl-CoA carboxylase biotin carboxyl carrier protein
MDNKRQYSHDNDTAVGQVSTAQLRRLVHLLDESDVSEIEVKRPQERMRLVLRKVKADASHAVGDYQVLTSSLNGATGVQQESSATPADSQSAVNAPLVGIFQGENR